MFNSRRGEAGIAKRNYDLEERFIDFAVLIIDLVEALPDRRAATHVGGQLLRSGTSPAPNYGEAQGAESRRDFVHKMKVVLKELKESRVWLKIIRKKSYLPPQSVEGALKECEELIRIVAKSISTASEGFDEH